MRATIKNYLEAMKQRREEEGEKGFSLIELIIVVVILGILVAIAVPIFVNIQQTAERNAVAAAAANAATSAAAAVAADASDADVVKSAQSAGTNGISSGLAAAGGTTVITTPVPTDVSGVCAVAIKGGVWAKSGPGCTGTLQSWTP